MTDDREPTDDWETNEARRVEPDETGRPTDGPPGPGAADGRPAFEHRATKHGLIGPFGARQLGGGLVVIVIVVILLLAVTAPIGTTGTIGAKKPLATPFVVGPAPAQGLRPGDRAPEFSVTRADGTVYRLTDLQGHPVSLSALRGHPVWVNFWASWCPPCQEETPVLRDAYNAYKAQGLVIVGISVQESNAADVSAYATKYGLGYTIAADLSGDIFRLYRTNVLPTQFFIDPNGIIRDVVLGEVDAESAAAEIQSIMSGAPPASPAAASPAASSPAASSPGASGSP